MSTLRIAGVIDESIVDGPGIRYVIFTQGCPHNCEGCHNPQTHDFDGGTETTTEKLIDDIHASPMLSGVTFSGGEPFCQPEPLIEIAKQMKADGKNIMAYSGYTFEELENSKNDAVRDLLAMCDVLVDGRFVLAERDLTLKFRGSRNQRLIDVQKSISQGHAVPAEI